MAMQVSPGRNRPFHAEVLRKRVEGTGFSLTWETMQKKNSSRVKTMPEPSSTYSRKTITSVMIDPNIRCVRIYPVETARKELAKLKTIGIKMTREQAIHFPRVLLGVSQNWDEIEITAYRFKKRKSDGTYQITISSPK